MLGGPLSLLPLVCLLEEPLAAVVLGRRVSLLRVECFLQGPLLALVLGRRVSLLLVELVGESCDEQIMGGQNQNTYWS